MFVDADLARDKSNRHSQTGVLIFINKASINWYIKRQETVEASTFGAELCAIKAGVEMAESLHYNLRMIGVPIDGSANVFCDNEAVYKNKITPESVLNKKNHYIAYHRCREAVATKNIMVAKQVTDNNISALFTNIMTE